LTRQNGAARFAAGAEIITLIYTCPAIVVDHVWELNGLIVKSLLRQFDAASVADSAVITIWIVLQPRVAKQAAATQRWRLVATAAC
jgi:hypothetical protein